MGAWWRFGIGLCLVVAVFCLHPRQADSGGMTVDLDDTGDGVKAGLNIVVGFVGPSFTPEPFPPSLMRAYEPIFQRAAEILYDATEGDVYIKTIEFTNVPDRIKVADVVFYPFLTAQTLRARAAPVGWQLLENSRVALVLEKHVCDQDREAESFDVLKRSSNELGGTCQSPTGDTAKEAECRVGQWLFDLCECEDRAPFGVAHELGHYLFGLKDEYSGELWNNCNTALEAICGQPCPLVESCDDDPDPEACKRSKLRTVVPTEGVVSLSLAPGEMADTALTTVQMKRPARDLVITLDLDLATFPAPQDDAGAGATSSADVRTASDMVNIVLRRPGGNVADATIRPVANPPKVDADGNAISACQQQKIQTEGEASLEMQSFRFTDNGVQKIWTITNPFSGNWVAEVRSTANVPQTVQFAYRVNYKCSFRCAAHTADRSGTCASNSALSSEACVMDGGTSTSDRNQRTEYCTAHGMDPSTGHDAGVQENDLSDGCKVVSFVNGQELTVGRSCWWSVANSQFRKRKILKLTDEELSVPLTDAFIERIAKTRRVVLSNGQKATADQLKALLGERIRTTRQQLPAALRPRFVTTPVAPAGAPLQAKPSANPTAMVADESEYVTGAPGIVFCVDLSSSMGDLADPDDPSLGSKIDLAVQAIRDSVNTLRDAEQFGVLGFSDTLPEIRAIGTALDGRDAFLSDIESDPDLFALGTKTRLGDCLQAVAGGPLLTAKGSEMSGKSVIVISDGRNTEGAAVADQYPALLAVPRLRVHTVALGSQADVTGLEELARVTGGTFSFAADAAELGTVIPRVMATARGEDEIFAAGFDLTPGETRSAEFELNPFLDSATLLLASEAAEDLTFTLENTFDGNTRTYTVGDHDPARGVEFRISPTQQFVRIADPRAGTWKLSVRAPPGTPAPARLLVFQGSSRLGIGTRVLADGCINYPRPLVVETVVTAPTRMTDLDVRMVVTHPGPDRIRSREIVMRDDGSAESGDREAGDGIFTALFNEFMGRDGNGNGGNGAYVVNVTARNVVTDTSNGFLVPGDDGEALQPKMPVREPFTILDETCALVCGVPTTIEDGYAILQPITPILPAARKVSALEVSPVFAFTLEPRKAWLLLEALELHLEVPRTGDPATEVAVEKIEMVGLYTDADKDGQADNRLNPLAWSRFQELVGESDAETRRFKVVFDLGREPADGAFPGRRRFLDLLATGRSHQFLVTLGQPRPRDLSIESSMAMAAGAAGGRVVLPLPPAPPAPPLVLVVLGALSFLMLVLTHRLHAPRLARHATTAGFVALLFLVFLAVGCGGGGGGGGGEPPLPPGPPCVGPGCLIDPVYTGPIDHKPRQAIAGRYRFTLAPSDVSLRSVRADESGEGAQGRDAVGGTLRTVMDLLRD